MSKKLLAITDREVIKVAKKLGFTFYRHTGRQRAVTKSGVD